VNESGFLNEFVERFSDSFIRHMSLPTVVTMLLAETIQNSPPLMHRLIMNVCVFCL